LGPIGDSKPRSAHIRRLGGHEWPESGPMLEPDLPPKGMETLTAPHFFNDIGRLRVFSSVRPEPYVGADAVAGLGLAERR
jgi:hypothetical protein